MGHRNGCHPIHECMQMCIYEYVLLSVIDSDESMRLFSICYETPVEICTYSQIVLSMQLRKVVTKHVRADACLVRVNYSVKYCGRKSQSVLA